MKSYVMGALTALALFSVGCTQSTPPPTPAASTAPKAPASPAAAPSSAPVASGAPSAAPSAAPSGAAGSPAASASGAPANFQTFSPADGSFTVDTPAALTEKVDGKLHRYQSAAGPAVAVWEVDYIDIEPADQAKGGHAKIVTDAMDGVTQGNETMFREKGKVSETYPAEMALIKTKDGKQIAVQVFASQTRIWIQHVDVPKEVNIQSLPGERFMKSIKVKDAAPKISEEPKGAASGEPEGKDEKGGEKSEKGADKGEEKDGE